MRSWVVLLVLWVAAPAAAQEACEGGRVRESHGRCCWPGQTWARDIGRCEGPPSCPPGTTAEGDGCISAGPIITPVAPPPVEPAAPIYRGGPIAPGHGAPVGREGSYPTVTVGTVAAPHLASGPAEWPTAPTGGLDGIRNPELVRQQRTGLVVAGGIVFGLGYASAIASASIVLGSGPATYELLDSGYEPFATYSASSCRDQTGGWFFLPIIGPIAALATGLACGYGELRYDIASGTIGAGPETSYPTGGTLYATAGLIAGPIAAVFQIIGFGLLLGGLLDEQEVLVPERASAGSLRLTLMAGAAGADVGGLTLGVSL